jgi:2-C-methyl-D-erythritol 4-phosphate cytidylyltransferase
MPARYFGLVPAAGTGTRIGSETPKQYLVAAGRPLVEHAVRALAADPRVEIVFVVLAAGDTAFARIGWGGLAARVAPLYCGGPSRRESVHNGLIAASDVIELDDWVLVHDAARPCLARADVARLIDVLSVDEVGGLLGAPAADTLKRVAPNERVEGTAERGGLWHAQTPQMFRHGTLLRALDAVRAAPPEVGAAVTDEASAVERLGLAPRMVAASAPNPKVTYAADLAIATAILNA